ncbi:hypothetical protein NQ317_001001 [Molorchus minor]|uniref:PiggyBac transposable element-derived protein domain-containing protein n=1 Tax=Molorchus minor TaxID=1323400 RepID=A0ABQ9JBW6_9CUCU|nr:hypothetical protein NQ317_001001 [Molorchus minor]
MELSTPYQFFRYFSPMNYFQRIADESNLYSIQKNISKPANIRTGDIKKYIGICIYMSVINMSNIRRYWSEHYGFDKNKNYNER